MDKRSFLQTLLSERSQWEALLARVSPARMTEPAINGGWSIKDTIGHVAYYEGWLLAWLEAAVHGKVTIATHLDMLDVDARNAIVFARNASRPLSDVLYEDRHNFERLVGVVQLIPESELLAPHLFERFIIPFWGTRQPLWKCIANDTYEHYQQHIPNIQAWLVQPLDRHAEWNLMERQPR